MGGGGGCLADQFFFFICLNMSTSDRRRLPSNCCWLPFKCRPVVCLSNELATGQPKCLYLFLIRKKMGQATIHFHLSFLITNHNDAGCLKRSTAL